MSSRRANHRGASRPATLEIFGIFEPSHRPQEYFLFDGSSVSVYSGAFQIPIGCGPSIR